ncbi:MarR family winged helix-turn-helix transcriptional regulator [Cupriavidus basilensis]|uniref:MarR family winged helix-turn-helix transcriptional regulator n=1 Tax=Cupriavidus basilensis TaxID=68895 RepID=UPI00157B908D|nr:MarR family winged helix-turn-helix transcriptional regulator [Cupriavidus basilensis]
MRIQKSEQLTSIVLSVFQLNGRLLAWGDSFVAPLGLTSARWQMLGALALAGKSLTAPQIAANMGVTRQGALKQLNLLADEGFIEARPNPMHKRSPLYVLTERGQRTYRTVDRQWREHAAKLATAFSAADLEAAARVVEGLAAMHAEVDAEVDAGA